MTISAGAKMMPPDRRKSAIRTTMIILVLTVLTVFLFADRAAVYFLAKTNNLDVSYKGLKKSAINEFIFNDLKVIEKNSSLGFSSRHAAIRIKLERSDFLNAVADIDLRGVFFLRGDSPNAAFYDSLAGLVSTPFSSRWTYNRITGSIRFLKNGIGVKNLSADSAEIRLVLNGNFYFDKKTESEVIIYFSDRLVKKIPEELSRVVLRDESGGWKSLSVRLSGNYASPAIQITGKLFRLSIGASEAK